MEKNIFKDFDEVIELNELGFGDGFKGCYIVRHNDYKKTDEYKELINKYSVNEMMEAEFEYELFKLIVRGEGTRTNVADSNGNILYDRWFTDIISCPYGNTGYCLMSYDYYRLETFRLNRDGTYAFDRKIVVPFDVKALTMEEYDKVFGERSDVLL